MKNGGRKKGTPNKITKELRETIKEILESEFKKMPEILKSLDPEKRMNLLIKLLPFVVPKLETTTIKQDKDEDLTIFIDYK